MHVYLYRYNVSNPVKEEIINIPPFSIVETVVQKANINAEEMMITVNDKRAYLQQILEEGDVLKIFPFILGG